MPFRLGRLAAPASALLLVLGASWAVGRGGPLWRLLASKPVFDAALARTDNEWGLVEACSVLHFGPRGPAPDVWIQGNSTAFLAVRPQTLGQAWRAGGRTGSVARTWMALGNMLGMLAFTRQVLTGRAPDDAPRTIVLALEPGMTLDLPDDDGGLARLAAFFDAAHPPPDLRPHGGPRLDRGGGVTRWLADHWTIFRYRTALATAAPGLWPFGRPARPPLVRWLRGADHRAFAEWRQAFARSRSVQDYVRAYDAFPEALGWMGLWQFQCKTGRWRPPNTQWAAFETWADLLQARGIQPVVVILPQNPLVLTRELNAALGGPAGAYFIDPALYAQWRADVTAFCARRSIPLVDHMDALPPEAFFDHHHLRFEYGAPYTLALVDALTGVVPPSPAGTTAAAAMTCPW